MVSTDKWICPGHGSPVEKDGRFYFLYHGYDKETNAFTGRQGLLNEFTFTPDGWVEFVNQSTGSQPAPANVNDKFNGVALNGEWQWSVFEKPLATVAKGRLALTASPSVAGAFVAQKIMNGNYNASVVIDPLQTTAAAGLSAIGDEKNTLSIMYAGNKITFVQLKDGKTTELAKHDIQAGKKVYLIMDVTKGKNYSFYFSTDGKKLVNANTGSIDGTYLPPWDRAVRVGLISKGTGNQLATFDDFRINYGKASYDLHEKIN